MICGLQNRFVNIILLFIVVITNNKHWSVLNDLHHMSLNITFIKWKGMFRTEEENKWTGRTMLKNWVFFPSYYSFLVCWPIKVWSEIFFDHKNEILALLSMVSWFTKAPYWNLDSLNVSRSYKVELHLETTKVLLFRFLIYGINLKVNSGNINQF